MKRICGLFILAALCLKTCAVSAAPFKAGVDVLLSGKGAVLRNKKTALITHPAAVTASMEPSVDALYGILGSRLVALMGPEHGIRGAAYAGESVFDQRDSRTGIPVYSLYDKSLAKKGKPSPEMLKGVDAIVYDVQDIGSRSYTYISTLALAMEAAADAGIEFIVLDRPNPAGGRIEGNVPPKDWTRSFVNWLPVPYTYGMTPGELALMINGEGWLPDGKKCRLKVIKMKGWTHDTSFAQTKRQWVPTSPHIPHAETACFYAATGILGELGVINEGVGYPQPFELLGAPWIDGDKLAEKLNSLKLPGVLFRPLFYKPFYGTHKGTLCGGVQIYFTDVKRAPWTALQFYAIEQLRALYPEHPLFSEAKQENRDMFDKVMGTPKVREHLEAGRPVKELLEEWKKQGELFRAKRKPYLLYP